MGDRVVFQVHNSQTGEYGPILYSHWGADAAEPTIRFFKQIWKTARGVGVTTKVIICAFKESAQVWNANKLTDGEFPGDAGAVLLDVATGKVTCLGGYLNSSDYNLTE